TDSPALREAKEREGEVLDDIVRVPTSYVAVEKILPAGDAGHPQVTTSGDNLELLHHSDEFVPLVRQVVLAVDQGKVPVDDTPHRVGPGLLGAVRLGARIRPLVDDLALLSELHYPP